jgi:hypothetical protein
VDWSRGGKTHTGVEIKAAYPAAGAVFFVAVDYGVDGCAGLGEEDEDEEDKSDLHG